MLFIVSYLIIPLPQIQVPKWIILRLCLNSNSKAPNWHQRKWNELIIFIIVILLRPRKNNSQSLKELELSINKQWRSQVHMCQEKRQHQFNHQRIIIRTRRNTCENTQRGSWSKESVRESFCFSFHGNGLVRLGMVENIYESLIMRFTSQGGGKEIIIITISRVTHINYCRHRIRTLRGE